MGRGTGSKNKAKPAEFDFGNGGAPVAAATTTTPPEQATAAGGFNFDEAQEKVTEQDLLAATAAAPPQANGKGAHAVLDASTLHAIQKSINDTYTAAENAAVKADNYVKMGEQIIVALKSMAGTLDQIFAGVNALGTIVAGQRAGSPPQAAAAASPAAASATSSPEASPGRIPPVVPSGEVSPETIARMRANFAKYPAGQVFEASDIIEALRRNLFPGLADAEIGKIIVQNCSDLVKAAGTTVTRL